MKGAKAKLFSLEHFRQYSSNLVLDSGDYWALEDFQAEIVETILDPVRRRMEGTATQSSSEVWVVLPEGNAKLEPLDAVLPTPEGWTTMGDVKVGDRLLGSDGLPVGVIALSGVLLGRDCYRVTFGDGASRVVGGDHLWYVEDAQDHYRGSVRSTAYLASRALKLTKRGKGGVSEVARWRVPTAARKSGPAVALPVDPYTLGVWLADGDTTTGQITNPDLPTWARIASAGYSFGAGYARGIRKGAIRSTVLGLVRGLREAAVLGDKHIPADYLVAPEADRWALLQGLVDSDGTVSKAGQVTYSSSRQRLAEDVRRLAWSLGLPCTSNETRATLSGQDYGPTWKLVIACDRRHPVVSLPRKVARLKRIGLTADHRRIVAIESVPSVPAQCVMVDSADGLYLTGEAMIPTHNTTLMAGIALYLCDWSPLPWIPVGASTRDQAEILAQQAYQMIRMSPGMERRFRIYEGYRRIQPIRPDHPAAGRRTGIKVMAADSSSGDGVIPFPLAICDEGHRHPDMRLYRLWRGKLLKRGGTIVMISTAGAPGHEFEVVRDQIREKASSRERKGAHLISRSTGVVMHEWQVEKAEDAGNMKKVKEANPLASITEANLQGQFDSPTTDLGFWLRLKCNIPARGASAAISAQEWDTARAALEEIPLGSPVALGVDVAFRHDTFAIVPLFQARSFRLLGAPIVLVPPRDGSSLHVDAVKIAFEHFFDSFRVDTIVMDTSRAEDIASWLEEQGVRVIDWPQGNPQAAADYEAFMKALRDGSLKHTGDRILEAHAMHAVARALPGDKRRFDRPSSSRAKGNQDERVIDALSAASFVNTYAADPPKRLNAADYRIVAL